MGSFKEFRVFGVREILRSCAQAQILDFYEAVKIK